MSDEIKKELSEVETLKSIRDSIKEEINKLQITLSNLQAQEHTALVKDERDDKLKEVEVKNKYAAEERRLEEKRIETEKRIDIAEMMERHFADREREIEKREQKAIDLETHIAELNKRRANFEEYKTAIEKELEIAKNTIAEANALEDKIEIERQSLIGREKKILEQEKYWNDLIGMLEEDKRKFEIEKENILGLKTIKKEEAINV